MRTLFTFSLLLTLIIGCSDDLPKTESEQVAQLLENKPIANKLEYISSRGSTYGKSNPIDALFEEILENDIELRKLIEASRNIEHKTIDDYQEYKQVNQNYWYHVNDYLSSLKDTVKREKVRLFFDDLNNTYQQNIFGHEKELETIEKKKEELTDNLILLKLALTKPMMDTYQKDNLAELEELRQVTKTYDSLISILEGKTKSIRK